jgi:hypothetical protein
MKDVPPAPSATDIASRLATEAVLDGELDSERALEILQEWEAAIRKHAYDTDTGMRPIPYMGEVG